MRNLTQEEIDFALDDNGEKEEGAVAIEATVQELADLECGTCCGSHGNKTFKALVDKGYGHRKCRGWYLEKPPGITDEHWKTHVWNVGGSEPLTDELRNPPPVVMGMFHIKVQTEKTGEKISRIAGDAHGSLRYSGESLWEGFKEFEIE